MLGAWSSRDRPFQAILIRWAATTSTFGLRASSHHCPDRRPIPTTICASIEASGGSWPASRERAFLLAIHHDRVQAFLAAEVLVDGGLGNSGLRRDLLDGRAFEAPLGEKPAADVEQLLPALPAGHALAVIIASGRIGHSSILPVRPPSGHPGFACRAPGSSSAPATGRSWP